MRRRCLGDCSEGSPDGSTCTSISELTFPRLQPCHPFLLYGPLTRLCLSSGTVHLVWMEAPHLSLQRSLPPLAFQPLPNHFLRAGDMEALLSVLGGLRGRQQAQVLVGRSHRQGRARRSPCGHPTPETSRGPGT